MVRVLTLLGLFLSLAWAPQTGLAESDGVIYKVRQTVQLGPIDAGARHVQWWVAIPGDDPCQRVLDFAVVSTPGQWSIVGEPDHGGRFLFIEAQKPGKTQLEAVVDFTLHRRPIALTIDPERVGSLDEAKRAVFAESLGRDAPHMKVTAKIQQLADEVCGKETNLARQARALMQHVASVADHYSKDPSKPHCGIGDAEDCLTNGGGCCTDLHSLYIALARARGIPARLQMGYRMLARNAGKEVDPGYRCWAETFLPGYGWVPADIVEADATTGLGPDFWFSGLTQERLWLNQGRELLLSGGGTQVRVNHMSHGHALVDGKPARILPEGELPVQISRKVRFEILDQNAATAL